MPRKKPKMGRPRRHEGERLSKMRTFRIRPHLDELLQTAAAKAGRSVSEEIEYRLDRSFYGDGLRDRITEIVKLTTKEAVEEAVLRIFRPRTAGELEERLEQIDAPKELIARTMAAFWTSEAAKEPEQK